MDKRTLLAVVLSVVIITVFYGVQLIFFPDTMPTGSSSRQARPAQQEQVAPQAGEEAEAARTYGRIRPVEEEGARVRQVEAETDVFRIAFTTQGARVTSLQLKKYSESDERPVEMVLSGETGEYPFAVSLEDYDTSGDTFVYNASSSANQWLFTKRYVYMQGGREIPFVLKKRFVLRSGEYLMEVRLSLETEEKVEIPVESYTLTYGPQIGPEYDTLDNRNAYRNFIYYSDGKRKNITGKVKNEREAIEDRFSWMAVEGKYFIAIGISYISDLTTLRGGFDSTQMEGIRDHSAFFFERDLKSNLKIEDGYKFYVGPKKREILARYSDSDKNAFQESGLSLEEAVPSSFWGWLSNILKWLLEMFYGIIPNWGVAIILLTALIKVIFFPLTHKSYESTHRMQELGPKIQELREKHKNNQQKMNQELAALYKREGVNPIGGCLPLLLQLPIFLALYSLFNNYFELRGASFLYPWIRDLSSPESVLTLPFSIPFLGPELRLLPFIMLATTFVQQKISQSPGQSQKQMKMLMYAMPLFFFFILYNMPSGLLLYWTMQNLFTFATQYYINHKKAKSQNESGDKK